MSTTLKSGPEVVKKRGSYRRLLVVTALVIFGSVAGWMIWGAVRDWADARELQAYFAELEKREPGWRDRVYGKPLTQGQMDDHHKWDELQQVLSKNNAAWGPYRQGLYQGMYQNPGEPAAMWPAEQAEFIRGAHQYWLSVLKKLGTMETLPGHYRHVDKSVSSEQMAIQFWGQFGSTAYVVNECVELEVMYHILMNDPQQAFQWFAKCRQPTVNQLYSLPFLLERWLNMTRPQAKTLQQMQQLLEQNARWPEAKGFADFGSELRLLEKSIRELAHGELTAVQVDRLGDQLELVNRDSPWKTPLLGWLRPSYLKYRMGSMFQRPSYLTLRLHQLADRVEELAQLDPSVRWMSWKNFAEAQSIMIDRDQLHKQHSAAAYSDVIPEGLFRLRARYVHLHVLMLFEIQAQLNSSIAAVAAERFRQDHGRFPKEWAELSPAYVDQPIVDPFTGKPLLIKLNEKGIVIYSVGRYGEDQGGENLSHNHYWFYGGKGWDFKRTNLGTRVYLPTLRRGPAYSLQDEQRQTLKENTAEMLKLMKEGKE